MKIAEYGKTQDGRTVTSYTLEGADGAELEVLDYGSGDFAGVAVFE